MPFVHIGKIVTFTPNYGVQVNEAALGVTPEELFNAVSLAFAHYLDSLLQDATAGEGPLAHISNMSFEQYLEALKQYEIAEAGRKAKRHHTRQRRVAFNSSRSRLVLALLDSGVPYVCCIDGCGCTSELTVDHIDPLSKGGTDELSNLRFMCRSHNSAKSDRREA
ncbi:MAG TPA: HNH endonuclease signature motif containing protein [Rhodanobacteraceae bacterium]|nr:HNH endonuclease signature motif containing protein [Rhodanobacteraceae bacterium]